RAQTISPNIRSFRPLMPPRNETLPRSGSTRLASVCVSAGAGTADCGAATWDAAACGVAAVCVVFEVCAFATPAMQTISIARTSVRMIHDFIGPPDVFASEFATERALRARGL